MMYAAVSLSAVVAVYVLFGLLGRRQATDSSHRMSAMFPLALPIATVAPAATLAVGFTVWSALIAALSVLVAVLAAGVVSRNGWQRANGNAPAGSAATWLCSTVVVAGFCLVLLEFTIGLAADLTGLSYWALAIPVVLGGVATGWGGGAGPGRQRTLLVGTLVVALLTLVAGLFLGSASYLGTRMMPAGEPGWPENIAFPIALVIAALVHPGLGAGRKSGGRANPATAIAASLVVLLTMAGLVMLLGGVMVAPSIQLNALVAYLPPAATTVLAAIGIAIAVTVVARSTELLLSGLTGLESLWATSPDRTRAKGRAGLAILLVIGWLILVAWSPSPVAVVGALAISSIVGLGVRFRTSRRHLPSAGPDGVDSVDAVDSVNVA